MDDISVGLGTGKAQNETAATCATCGRALTQCGPNGECLRCLISLTFLADGEHLERPAARGRLTPGPLRYAHFEVETGADGFAVELGAGAMAITYRARDTVLNSVVALKVIDRKVAQNPGARSRFLREARAAANIRHPNIARVTYYGEQDGECFYAMELVEGETLEARVRREGPMPLAVALNVIEQAARALAAAEACGVVHRDIKPSNVMLEADASGALRVKLIDYGVAKVMNPQTQSGAELTQAGFIGTPAFASPEQFAGAGQLPVDTRSDIYSLGVTLWYLFTGRTPFVGRTMEEIRKRQMSDLPLEHLKGHTAPGPGDRVTEIDAGAGSEGQTTISTGIAFCGPALLPTIQPRSAVAPQEGHAGERGLDLCHCSLCAWDLALPACAGIYPGGTLHRRAAFRESEQRQGERLLRRGNTGRNPHALIENRRSKGHFAHFHPAL